jgi:CheY-like chemotaxis protein
MSLPTSNSPVKVLIADDSAFMRAALSRMVQSDAALCVVGTAQTGPETLTQIDRLQPDVITLDIDMPGLSGLEVLKRVMRDSPRPIIVISSLAQEGAEATLEALELGAFDCLAKRLNYGSLDIIKAQDELVDKIKAAACSTRNAGRRSRRVKRSPSLPGPPLSLSAPAVVAIGTLLAAPKPCRKSSLPCPQTCPSASSSGSTCPWDSPALLPSVLIISATSTYMRPKKAWCSPVATYTWLPPDNTSPFGAALRPRSSCRSHPLPATLPISRRSTS